jgi:carbamoyl-phosphate synthase large subunit
MVLIPGLLEHVERAGVHSGDSVGMFPPQTVSEADQSLIVAAMERVVVALGAKGLVNAQFIVREDGVYLIEVNPRASRTVPFLSKVTGVPMVELAVRIALGATLSDLGWENRLLAPPPFVAVKAPAFSTTKLRGVDPSVGPSMQSTGEVIGIHRDPRVALAKALRGAGLVPAIDAPVASFAEATEASVRPAPIALLSIADRDKAALPRLAAALDRAGFRLAATPGTRAAILAAGLRADPVAKLGAEPKGLGDGASGPEVGLLDLLRGGTVRLVVNTPTPRSGAVRDAAEIRHTAIAEGVPCLTAIETAVAAAEALDPEVDALVADVRSLLDWTESAGLTAPASSASRPALELAAP